MQHLSPALLNPIDDALKNLKDVNADGYTKEGEVPYDFIRKKLSIVVRYGNQRRMITKGALKNILDICDRAEVSENKYVAIDTMRSGVEKVFEEYSSKGFRTIGICFKEMKEGTSISKEEETGMIFGGFVLLYDPPKEGITEVILQLKNRGVTLKMITGDNKLVAAYIGSKIGCNTVHVITGSDLQKMSPEALVKQVASIDVFAEIEPHQKEHIIVALQKAGNAVAYIGDGINDVTAIHAADAGISVNNAVDVAKEAADIVLLEKDLGVLEQESSRGVKHS